MSRRALCVVGIEAVTPVGLDWAETGGALRARMSGLVEHPYLELVGPDLAWDPPEPLRMGLVPSIDPLLAFEDRVLRLAIRAVQGLVTRARLNRRDLASVALIWGLPERESIAADVAAALPAKLVAAARLDAVGYHEVIHDGHPALFRCLAQANAAFHARRATMALVVLIDSFADDRRIRHYHAAHRLRSQRNADGFLPGEAGIALLVEPLASGRSASGREILGFTSLPSFGDEPNSLDADLAATGAGLTQAVLAQIARSGPIRWVVSDLNGEQYGAFEWNLVQTRLIESLGTVRAFHHPLESTGDVGAATGGVLAAQVLHAFARGTNPAPEALLFSSSSSSTRAAVTLYAP